MNNIWKVFAIYLAVAALSTAGIEFFVQAPAHGFLQKAANSPTIAEVHGILSIPLADDRALIGASHNVFVAKVASQVGVRQEILSPGVGVPISQFSVEPILNIKGNLQRTVMVEQFGGYQSNGVLVVGDGGDAFGPSSGPSAGHLMQPGSTYLLSTRYESDGVYYLWDFPTASKLISEDRNLSDSQLQSLATNDGRVQQLEVAYPNEILVADDVRTGNTRNSWLSLHPILPPPPPTPPAPSSTPATVSTSTATSTGGL